jgi:hypothetical protein
LSSRGDQCRRATIAAAASIGTATGRAAMCMAG